MQMTREILCPNLYLAVTFVFPLEVQTRAPHTNEYIISLSGPSYHLIYEIVYSLAYIFGQSGEFVINLVLIILFLGLE